MPKSVTLCSTLLMMACAASVSTPAVADAASRVDVPPGDLVIALRNLAKQSGAEFVYSADRLKGVKTPGVQGEYTTEEAVTRLLEGTKLKLTVHPTGALLISDVSAGSAGPVIGGNSFRLAQAVASPSSGSAQQLDTGSQDARGLRAEVEEVIVTATRRAESLQDVPLSIAVVRAEDIDRRGLVSAEDYLRGIPGVSQGNDYRGSAVIIRGLETSTSFQNFSSGPTVATYFGETPTTNSAGLNSNGSVDIKLVDIERVEVLRGPQGTAFGSASLGGAVRTIPVAPKLDRLEGKVAANYSVTAGEGSGNHMIQGVGNIPLIDDELALRAVAYRYEDSGYYKNTSASNSQFLADVAARDPTAVAFARNADEIGASVFTGGRVSALWQPTEDLKVSVSYLTQKTEIDGLPLSNIDSDDRYGQVGLELPPEHIVRGQRNGFSDSDLDLANAVVEYDLGWADLLGSYSYVKSGSRQARPYSMLVGTPFYATTLSQYASSDHEEQVGELRLATKLDGSWNFLIGVYGEKLEDSTVFPFVWAGDPAANFFGGGRYPGDQRDYLDERDLEQTAAFAEASWEFLPGLTLTGGARMYRYDRNVQVRSRGTLYGNQATNDHIDESDSTFRANLRYKPNESAMVYASWSEGFRLGKPQPGLPVSSCDLNGDGLIDGSTQTIAATRNVNSDTVESTEIGGKFSLFDRRLSITAALFRVEWDGMPFTTSAPLSPDGCGQTYIANAGAARSQGIESQATLQLTKALSIDVGGSYINAELTEAVPAQSLPSGTRLPGSPEWNANLGIQYGFDLGGHDAFLRADSIYIGSFSGSMPYALTTEAGGYLKVDLTTGIAIRNVNVSVFVRNLTDADDFSFRSSEASYTLRPRTIGLQVGYDF